MHTIKKTVLRCKQGMAGLLKNLVPPPVETLVQKELCCPKCKELLSAPIYHCDKGHSFCSFCYKSDYICMLCGADFNGGRTHHLERIVALYNYPCKYSHKGCKKKSKINKLKAHEEWCQKFKIDCPFGFETNCRNIGNRQQTVFHCQLAHSANTYVGTGQLKFHITDQFMDKMAKVQKKLIKLADKDKDGLMFSLYMVSLDDILFLVVLKYELQMIRVNVYRISSPSEMHDEYQFIVCFYNDAQIEKARVPFECTAVDGYPFNPLRGKDFVHIDLDIMTYCRYCSVEVAEKK